MSRFNRHCNLIGISLVNQIGIVKWKSHSNVSSMAGIPIVDIGATLKCDSNAFPMSTIAMCALGTLGLHSNSIRKWVAWDVRHRLWTPKNSSLKVALMVFDRFWLRLEQKPFYGIGLHKRRCENASETLPMPRCR